MALDRVNMVVSNSKSGEQRSSSRLVIFYVVPLITKES